MTNITEQEVQNQNDNCRNHRLTTPGEYNKDVDAFPEVVAMLIAPYLSCRSAIALAATRKNILRDVELDLGDEEIDQRQIKAVARAGVKIVGVSMPCPTGALDDVCEHLSKLRKLKCTGPVDLTALSKISAPLREVDLGEATSCSKTKIKTNNNNNFANNNHNNDHDNIDMIVNENSENNILDVAPLASCSSLKVLDLADTKVADVSSLLHCKDLTKVRLTNTRVVDLAPLARGCGSKLEELDVRNTRVADTRPLAQCKGLKFLNFEGSEVEKIEPLASCQNLEVLNLRDTRILNIQGLGSLTKLRKLHLGRAPISSLESLSTCSSLREVGLESTWVMDLRPLNSCPIEILDIRNTRVASLQPLGKGKIAKSLQFLYASQCKKMASLTGLSACTNLRHLDVASNDSVWNVMSLERCYKLESLFLQQTQVKDITPLAYLKNLKILNLAECKELDDRGIRDFCNEGVAAKSLQTFNLSETRVGKIDSISNCENLRVLTLSKCPVSSISALRSCQNLTILYLQNTFVKSAIALACLPKLETVYFSNAPLANVEWARGGNCRNLQTLFLDSTKVCNLSALRCCPRLQLLNVSHTNVADVQEFQGRSSLRMLGLPTLKKLRHSIGSPMRRRVSASTFPLRRQISS